MFDDRSFNHSAILDSQNQIQQVSGVKFLAVGVPTWLVSFFDSPPQVGVEKTSDVAVQNVAKIGG